MSPEPLSAHSITKSFSGVPTLLDGQLELRRGTVHALCGGNGAGKSTFLNILMGLLRRDSGTVQVRGQKVDFAGPADALAAGISMISQELDPIPGMSVAENIFLGREPRRMRILVDYRQLIAQTEALLRELEMDIPATAIMSDLSLAQIQMIEIAKAISHRSEILIMDEPTSAIGEQEATLLFKAIERLTARGAGIIYVSHRMNELYRIADDYSIFRDGRHVESGLMADVDRGHLINQIIGSKMEEEYSKLNVPGARSLLKVEGYSRKGEFSNVSLDLHEGEILGIFGLTGAGRSEFLNSLFGLSRPDAGQAWIGQTRFQPLSPREAMSAGLALVTEDRKDSGLVLSGSIRSNISLASLPSVARSGFISGTTEIEMTDAPIESFKIRCSSRNMLVGNMSGGNQQKVVLAKWMRTNPSILLLDEPTRGIDVGAKREMYQFMSEFATPGRGIVMVSSEIREILGMSDRVAVFRRGSVSGILSGADLNQENLAHLAS
jgi:putative xylitol transport system ATP-binding protein